MFEDLWEITVLASEIVTSGLRPSQRQKHRLLKLSYGRGWGGEGWTDLLDYTALVQMAVSVSELYLQFVIESLLLFSDGPLEIQ